MPRFFDAFGSQLAVDLYQTGGTLFIFAIRPPNAAAKLP
jgi:hypothetical protein